MCYNLTLWLLRLTTVAMVTKKMPSMCITELHVSKNGTKILDYCTNTFVANLCHRNNSTLLGFIVRYSILLPDCKEFLGFSRQIFTKAPNIKFHTNPSSRSRTDTYGQTAHDEANRLFSPLSMRA